MMRHSLAATLSALAIASALAQAAPAVAREQLLSLRNSFRIGSAGVTCTAQNAPFDPRLNAMFDRGYRITCRDAASMVGTLVALRRPISIAAEPIGLPGVKAGCGQAGQAVIDEVGTVAAVTCRSAENVDYRRYAIQRGGVSYLVEGLAGYDPALRLALASVVNDRTVPGEVRVATTEVSDAAAFAKVQAGSLEAEDARSEAYLRNNMARFAEAAEFFESLATRERRNPQGVAEALANQGLQQSNLGNFSAAERLFAESAGALPRRDGIGQRLLRNYRAINALNQRRPEAAIEALQAKVDPVQVDLDEASLRAGMINLPLSEQINRENEGLQRLGGIDPGLTPAERAEILDAQAEALGATAARQQGRLVEAATAFASAATRIAAVREGRVASASWLRSEIEIERALIAEAQGRRDEAAGRFDEALRIIQTWAPQSPALLAAQARKAAFLARGDDAAQALALYASVVEAAPRVPDSGTTLRDLLSPYFGLLAKRGDAAAADLAFSAAQVLQRPGVAQTQAILARELSEGNDEAAALFRLTVARSREIARTESEISQLSAVSSPSVQQVDNLAAARSTLSELQSEQTRLLSRLAEYPRYNVLAPDGIALAELRAGLRPGEAYYKMMVVGGRLYGLLATPSSARLVEIPGTADQLADEVQLIRDSIATVENGETINFPFEVAKAHALYLRLFGSVDPDLRAARHLIFEPDGAMLQLPPSVLVTDARGVQAYEARIAKPDADAFDFRGVDWLGRDREVTIAVSPRGFLDIRRIKPSAASRMYLGLGNNAVPAQRPLVAAADECDWPLAAWQNPIKPDELYFAQQKLADRGAAVRVGRQFSDSELLADPTLKDYRILHFATHGIVSPPRPECPPRPALVTSFGDQGSDGLLSFREIFDMKLDADLVILSACNTAGMATVGASREAGVTTGGNFALDGLVRAFVGAGGRSVIASHWPVPDDYDATKRLISGVIEAAPGVSLSRSLATAQGQLMDQAETSHPFYWAAFIVLGDGAKSLLSEPAGSAARAR